MDRKSTGELGENMAAHYLQSKGYIVKENNFHSKYGEIDLIAEKNDQHIFVEVKTRISTRYGSPEESLIPSKIKKLLKTIHGYFQKRNLENISWRLDAIAIQLNRKGTLTSIKHFKNLA